MKSKLTELKDPLISDEEYDEWMRIAKLGDPIPESIHRYFREVLEPRHEISWKKWQDFVKNNS